MTIAREDLLAQLSEQDDQIAALQSENKALREALFMCAAHCQGYSSTAGAKAAEIFGFEAPVSMEKLESRAKGEGFDPGKLWPWLKQMRARAALKTTGGEG